MKKILILLLGVSLSFTACKETQSPVYDGSQSLAYFDKTASNLPVTIDATGEIEVTVGVSTLSKSARNVKLTLVKTNAPSGSFTLPASVVIPADQYTAKFKVMGTDVGLSTSPNTIEVKLESYDGGVVSTSNHTISIFKICPIPSTAFVGKYLIEQTSALVDGPSLSSGTVVDLVRVDENTRKFQTENYPNFCSGTFMDFSFKLVCGKIIVNTADTTCRCTSVTDWFTAGSTPTSYDLSDDSVFSITFTDDSQSDCNPPVQTTYKFTKQ